MEEKRQRYEKGKNIKWVENKYKGKFAKENRGRKRGRLWDERDEESKMEITQHKIEMEKFQTWKGQKEIELWW